MSNPRTPRLLPNEKKLLEQLGYQIKMARLRRELSAKLVSERARISRATLVAIEKGSPSVAMGYYIAVLHALGGLDKDILLVAQDDKLGRTIQDLNLVVKKRVRDNE
ncbi:MAG: transcriptional regulator [Bacilli bacterium]|nr:transcriptional regulator [Bacilli bacterium]